MLHITDGESVAGTLRESGLPGVVSTYGDLMCEGPAPADLDVHAWIETRARFIADFHDTTLEDARQYLQKCEDTLAAFSKHEEVVIWLDHRLSDQLILIKVLDWFSRRDPGGVKLSLVCAGPDSGVENFVGLGALSADRLTPLADKRVPIDKAHYRTARAAWQSFTSADPTDIERFRESDTSALPYVAAALKRHLEEFPSVGSGLSRTVRQTLSVLRDQGACSLGKLCVAVWHQEEAVFIGDSSFYRIVTDLSKAPHPLVQVSGAPRRELAEVTITEMGRKALEGQADDVAVNGIDRWLGGVHLKGNTAAWRWDRVSARLAGL